MNKLLLFNFIFFLCASLSAQNIGIGVANPSQKLEVDGWIQLGDENTTSTPTEGAVRYNTSTKALQFYNGTQWVSLDGSSGGVVGADNGLSVNGNNDVVIGGNLTGNTTIGVGSNRFSITGSQSKIAIGEGAQIETGGDRSVALGNNAKVNGTESVAIGIGNTGTSTVTRSGSYSLAMGQNLGANNGTNGRPVIAIGSDFTNSTTGSIMIGNGSLVPSLTLVEGSGSTPGNVGIGTTDPVELLHLRGTQLNIRLQNITAGTGNSYNLNSTNGGNFRIVNVSDGLITLDIDANGNVGLGDALAINGANVNLGTDARASRFEFDDNTGFEPISGTWTSMDVYGSKNNYSGFNFKDVSRYLMVNGVYQGIHTGTGWQWRFDNGTLNVGTIPWARISGEPAQATTWQSLGTSGNSITLSNGGSVTAPYATNANYANSAGSANSVAWNNVSGKPGQATTWQTLGTSGNSITLSNGGSVTAPYANLSGGISVVKSGFVANELAGTSGAYFDLKDNAADDFDVRMIYYSNSVFDITNRTGGVRLNQNAGSWSSLSDSTKKTDFTDIDENLVLNKIQKMDLGSWRYNFSDNNDRHYGPMAQDFFAAFGNDGLGIIGNDTTINTMDIDGVMMIAIQGLIKENNSLKAKVQQLENKNDKALLSLQTQLEALEIKLNQNLRINNRDLTSRK